MTVEPVVGVIGRVVRSTYDLDAESLAVLCGEAGWVPAGATVQPFPRKWSHGKLQASIFSEGADNFLEFVFQVIPPDWDLSEYAEAVDGEYFTEIETFHRIRDELLAAVGADFSVEEIPDVKEDAVDFVESGCWKIGRGYLSAGVAHADEDSPILLLARLRQS
ncbi:hypothetical protein [Streptomyces sp. 4F14]|uniref:hypothetical protein n=1 Tax=Streptomyces sp. 4F14 TaxID=3394380 RepID=UPI003A862423